MRFKLIFSQFHAAIRLHNPEFAVDKPGGFVHLPFGGQYCTVFVDDNNAWVNITHIAQAIID